MDSNVKALIVKKFKDAELNLDLGRHWVDETVVVRVSGTVERHEDQWIAPTVSIPLIPTVAFFWERLGVEKDRALSVLRDAITEAMRAKVNESPSIKSKMDDVAAAVATVKRDLIAELPKMRRAGRTDVGDPVAKRGPKGSRRQKASLQVRVLPGVLAISAIRR